MFISLTKMFSVRFLPNTAKVFLKSQRCLSLQVEGMARAGEYGQASVSQQESYRLLYPHINQAIGEIQKAHSRRIVLADYGCADGICTGLLVENIRKKCPSAKLHLILNDLPTNDWAATASSLACFGETNIHASASTITDDESSSCVRFYSSPGSFHKQVVPSGSVDIATSGTAFHWLSDTSTLPPPETFHICSPAAEESARSLWREYAAKDWANVCASRHAELRQGGKFLSIFPAVDENGRFTYDTLFNTVIDVIFDEWVEKGILSSSLRKTITLPVYTRSLAEIESGLEKLFQVESIGIHTLRNPYMQDSTTPDVFAERYTTSIFAWGRRLFELALGNDTDLLIRFRNEMQSHISSRMKDFEEDYVMAVVVATKK